MNDWLMIVHSERAELDDGTDPTERDRGDKHWSKYSRPDMAFLLHKTRDQTKDSVDWRGWSEVE